MNAMGNARVLNSRLFIELYDPTGAPTWSRTFRGPGSLAGSAVAFDGKGHVVAGGPWAGENPFVGAVKTTDRGLFLVWLAE
jgi:hypothetical protein